MLFPALLGFGNEAKSQSSSYRIKRQKGLDRRDVLTLQADAPVKNTGKTGISF